MYSALPELWKTWSCPKAADFVVQVFLVYAVHREVGYGVEQSLLSIYQDLSRYHLPDLRWTCKLPRRNGLVRGKG